MPGCHGLDLMSMYPTEEFVGWFASTFGSDVPEEFHRFLDKHPRGTSGATGSIFPPCEIVARTVESDLISKGVCLIGQAKQRSVLLLRVGDGKVFVVDAVNFATVAATFAGMDICAQLLDLAP